MTSLHKFKLLATQCSISETPTHSPTTSPVFHLRRHRHRKTLRMFLSRSSDHHEPPPPEKRVRRKLKDLFVSSSPPIDHNNIKTAPDFTDNRNNHSNNNQVRFSPGTASNGDGLPARRRVMTSSGSFRYRFMLRRAWRPVLISIPEID